MSANNIGERRSSLILNVISSEADIWRRFPWRTLCILTQQERLPQKQVVKLGYIYLNVLFRYLNTIVSRTVHVKRNRPHSSVTAPRLIRYHIPRPTLRCIGQERDVPTTLIDSWIGTDHELIGRRFELFIGCNARVASGGAGARGWGARGAGRARQQVRIVSGCRGWGPL